MNVWLENILRYAILLLLQVLLFNNLQFFGVCSPCVYILFLIALPPTLPRWVELLTGFIAGLILDIFCNTLGVQTVACTMVSYLRPILIKTMVQDNDRLTSAPSGITLGVPVYIRMVTILVLVHHTAMFSLIAFSFHNWWLTLLQIICSSIMTILLILGWDFIRK